MARHHEIHEQVYQELTRIAVRKGNFTTTELRQTLGFPESGIEAQTMHNVIVSLKKAGIVRSSDSGRKRNQYLHVVQEKRDELKKRFDRIRRLKGGNGPPTGSPSVKTFPETPKKVLQLEQRVGDLEAQLGDLQPLADATNDRLEALETAVQNLVDLWS